MSVLAGSNGCGKSTVLFACASAYDAPDRAPRDLTPGSLFPDFTSRQPGVSSDARQPTTIEFHYRYRGDRVSMTWTRGRSWKRSFTNSDGQQPERPVYLRTLANLTNPSEVRGVLQLGRKQVETEEVAAGLLIFAHRILPWRYRNMTLVSGPANDLLFAELEGLGETSYSEFHMSSGERSIQFPTLAELSAVRQLSSTEVHALLDGPTPPFLLDVREPDEYGDDLGHIAESVLIPLKELPARVDEIEPYKAGEIVVVCRAGVRSTTAAAILTGLGFGRVSNLKGGMLDWNEHRLAVER